MCDFGVNSHRRLRPFYTCTFWIVFLLLLISNCNPFTSRSQCPLIWTLSINSGTQLCQVIGFQVICTDFLSSVLVYMQNFCDIGSSSLTIRFWKLLLLWKERVFDMLKKTKQNKSPTYLSTDLMLKSWHAMLVFCSFPSPPWTNICNFVQFIIFAFLMLKYF